MSGDPKIPELSSGEWAPGSTYRLPWLGECSRNPSVQSTSWRCCERLHSASVNCFWRLSMCVCIHNGWFTNTPAHTVVSVQQFLTKTTRPLCIQSHPQQFFFVFPDEKSPWRETFCRWGRGETKNVRSTKRHQNWWVQNWFEQWKKSLDRCITSNGEYFEGDWSLNV